MASTITNIPEDEGALAQRFERLIGWYPAQWRRENGDAFLDMLVEDAIHRGVRAPTRRDRWSLARGGLRERLLPFTPAPIISQIALLAGTAFSLFYALVVTWAPGNHLPGGLGPFSNPDAITGGLVLLAWLLAMKDLGWTSRVVAGGALVADIAVFIASTTWNWYGPGLQVTLAFAFVSAAAIFRVPRRAVT